VRSNPYYRGPVTDHFDGQRFYNPGEPVTDRSVHEVLRWQRASPKNAWPTKIDVQQIVPASRVDELTVTMIGHATVLIQIAGLNLLTDPVWSDRASPFHLVGPKRVAVPGIALTDLPPIDVILLSHNHFDHFDVQTLRKLKAGHSPLFVTPLGNDVLIRRYLPDARIETGDWGDFVSIGKNTEIHIVPANHWSGRSLHDRRMALWSGFMVRTAGRLIYFAGDTGYGTGRIFRNMRRQFGSPDLAILPCGAYDPRWFMATQHVDPEEAIQIMCDLDADKVLGMHWGVFKLTDEAWNDPAIRLSKELEARKNNSTRFQPMLPGQVAHISLCDARHQPEKRD